MRLESGAEKGAVSKCSVLAQKRCQGKGSPAPQVWAPPRCGCSRGYCGKSRKPRMEVLAPCPAPGPAAARATPGQPQVCRASGRRLAFQVQASQPRPRGCSSSASGRSSGAKARRKGSEQPRGVREEPGSGSLGRQGPIPALEHTPQAGTHLRPGPASRRALSSCRRPGHPPSSRSTRPPGPGFRAPRRRLTPDPRLRLVQPREGRGRGC